MTQTVRIATRGSALALAQARWVGRHLASRAGLEAELVQVRTHGDESTASLADLGGTGAFAIAVRDAVLDGRCDAAVHSLKDLPTAPCAGLVIAAIPPREDARDALCARDGLTLDTLPPHARVGTGSPRRKAQVLARRPDLDVIDLRGNVNTRLGRVGRDLDAVVLALAGLRRLSRESEATEVLDLESWPTAPGQGALAVEIREGDAETAIGRAIAALDDGPSRSTVAAERSVLAALEAGCSAPLGVAATLDEDRMRLTATVYSPNGRRAVTAHASVDHAEHTASAADRLIHRVVTSLFDGGARDLGALGESR